ncbi:hypothetical protein U5907_04100 [Bacteroidales bacterium MB20-C3-3]|nr:hypothetical protein U5907_04100 [Bacteroidales bacterium MB20-C3-3]
MKRLLNIVKTLVISLILILSSTAFGQNGYKFATERKGSVTSKTDIGYSFREIYPDKSPVYLKSMLEKISSVLLSSETVKSAKGVDIVSYGTLSEFTNVDLTFSNLARSDDDPAGEYYHKGSSSINVYINDTKTASGNILRSNFFELPVNAGEFNGFPVYDCGIYKYVLVAPGISNPFIPCTKEEYLNTIIKEEREKLKMFESSDNNGVRDQENMKEGLKETKQQYEEMKKMAESMKKSDPETAASIMEAVKGLELVIKEAEKNVSRDLKSETMADPTYLHYKEVVESLEEELALLSSEDRASQAIWSLGAQEITGKYSDLIPDNMREHGTPLYKLNPAIKHSSERIIFMVVMFLESNPGMERTPADGCVEKIKGESRIWREIFSLAGGS